MSLLNTIGVGTGYLSAGSSALGLISSTKALLGLSKDQGVKGINGFVFDIPQSEEATLSALITDHYSEDNTPFQDHIAVEPVRLRLTGQVAELVYTKDKAESYLNEVIDRLGPLGVLNSAGVATTRAYLAQYNQTKQAIDQAFTSVKNQINSLTGEGVSLNRQQTAWDKLETMFAFRSTIFDPAKKTSSFLSVETPWRQFDSMAIESITFSQDESTTGVSTVEITLKQIRFVKISTSKAKIPGRASSGVGVIDKGTAQGQPGSVVFESIKKVVFQ